MQKITKNVVKLSISMFLAVTLCIPNMSIFAEENESTSEIVIIAKEPAEEIVQNEDSLIDTTGNASLVEVNGSVEDSIEEYLKDPNVLYAVENISAEQCWYDGSGDLSIDSQFQSKINNACRYIESLSGLSTAKVAVLDSDFFLDEPDIKYNKQKSCAVNYQTSPTKIVPSKNNAHGSECASIIGSIRNNYMGTNGMASINSGRNLDLVYIQSKLKFYDFLEAMDYISKNNFDVLSVSLAFDNSNQYQAEIINNYTKKVKDSGCVVVAPAGNAGREENNNLPAASPYAIGVMGSNGNNIDRNSSYGNPYNLSAPYCGCVVKSNDITFLNGTSASTPFVAASAAHIKMLNPSLTPDQVQYILERTSTDVLTKGKDKYTGYGILNPLAVVQYAKNTNPRIKEIIKPVYQYKKGKKYQYSLSKKIKGWKRNGVAFKETGYGQKIYRFYNKKTKAYKYTTKSKLKGWSNRKVVFYASGNKPVYEAYNKRTKSYYYTTSYKKYKKLKKPWQKKGKAFLSR